MFELNPGEAASEKDRSRLIIVLSGLAVLIVLALIILVGSSGPRQQPQPEMARQGSADFDSYAQFIEISDIERSTAYRLNNYVGIIRARVDNTGDRTVTGLRIRGTAVGRDGEIQRERTITVVPDLYKTLPPKRAIRFEINIEPIPNPEMNLGELRIELYALKLDE